jgi:GntR family transcriptional regulator/MocR family aminotransferase
MTPAWSRFRDVLVPAVAKAARGKRGRTVETELRDAVREGRLASGTRLPSSRDLAAQLGVARGTITATYAQLVAEGYLVTQRGSGTVVAAVDAPSALPSPTREPEPGHLDLHPGLPSLSSFPRSDWLAAQKAGLNQLPHHALGYPDPAGLTELRVALTSYLGRVRAVVTEPDDVVITNGAAEGLRLVSGVLHRAGHRTIAVENPSHRGQAELLAAHGLRTVPVPVDEHGIDVDALAATGCRSVLVTAAHQFPLGVVLHPDRRRALVQWAADHDAFVIEDDYDAEHRYDRPALGAVQALNPARVIYQGSVSKVLAPALRLGWLVLPRSLRPEVIDRKRIDDLGTATLPQAAFAELLHNGGYDRHLRRTRSLYRRRRDAVLDALADQLPHWRPVGVAAGLHVVLRLPEGTDDLAVQERLTAHGISAPALSTYEHEPGTAPFPGLVIGYASTPPDRMHAAITALANAADAP